MSLRDEIKNLRGVAKIFKAEFNPQMNELEKFLNGKKIDVPVQPPEDILKSLLAKFLQLKNFFLSREDFSARELRSLPFIIYEPPIAPRDTLKILRLMDFSLTSHLRNVVHVYLVHYDDSEKTDWLRQLLYNLQEVDAPSLRKTFTAREYLFGKDRFTKTAKLFAQRLNIDGVLDELGLSNFYKSSNFIQAALKMFFRADKPLSAQLKILQEIDAADDTYQNIFTVAADALIQRIVANGNFGKPICMEIFYRRLGDPRFGNRRFNWDAISKNSREIFCRWIAEDDLELFFKITRETLRGNDNALNMWNARENFWRKYLPRIGITWVVLGRTTRQIAYRLQDRRTHGRLEGNTDTDKSGFLFQIGKYIFAEWSHDGALRVYPAQRVQDFIGRSFEKTKMMDVKVTERWVHSGAWQDKVDEWIKKHC